MKITLSICTLVLILFTKTDTTPVEIRFMKNIEFFGYIIELGDPSGNDPAHPISKLIHRYPENSANEKLLEIFSLAEEIDYATIVHLMYYLPEFPIESEYELPLHLARELGFETKEKLQTIQKLVNVVNSFYLESHFDSIWLGLESYRKESLTDFKKIKPSSEFMKNIESFYGGSFNEYEIVPSLTIWSGPAWGVTNSKREKATFILGPLKENYVFGDESFQSLAIHEFGHSFANTIVLKHLDQLDKMKELFLPVQKDMIPQGYSDWTTCMIEHVVRAGEVIVMKQLGESVKSTALLNDYKNNRKFIYLEFIVQRLDKYRLVEKLDYNESISRTLLDLEEAFLFN